MEEPTMKTYPTWISTSAAIPPEMCSVSFLLGSSQSHAHDTYIFSLQVCAYNAASADLESMQTEDAFC